LGFLLIKKEKEKLGQYITSPEIANLMISLISPKFKTGRILEPCFGTGVFLELLYNEGSNEIFGYELDSNFYKMIEEKFPDKISHFQNIDYLKTSKNEKFDIIIGNPPYVYYNNIEPEILDPLKSHPFWMNLLNGEWDLLYFFIVWSIEKLNPLGELIFITPYYWFNSTYAASLRKYVMEQGDFETIIHFGEMNLFKGCAPNTIIFKFIKGKTGKPVRTIEFKERKSNILEIVAKMKDIIEKFPDEEFEDENYKFFYMEQFKDPFFWFLIKPSEKNLCDLIENCTLQNVPELDLYKTSLAPKKVPLTALLDEKDLFSFNITSNKSPPVIKNRKNWYYIPSYQNNYLKLKHILTVCVGMVTGYDLGFRIDKEEFEILNEEEKSHVIQCIKGQNCERFFINTSEYYIYLDDVVDEKLLIDRFPNFYSKLTKFKKELIKRYNLKNKKWFHWATIRNKEVFEENFNKLKIFVPNLDRHKQSRFSLIAEEVYGSGDTLVIVKNAHSIYNPKESLKYFTAWLNSSSIQKWYQVKGSKRGHRTQYTQSYVEEIPVRLINWENAEEISIYDNIENIVDEILKIKEMNPNLENELEKNIATLISYK
jgi:adenine-specific DNA-methyltransferase